MIDSSLVEEEAISDGGAATFSSITILDRSPIRRSCIAAILTSFAQGEILTTDSVDELRTGDGDPLVLIPLETGDERLARLEQEISGIRRAIPGAKIAVVSDDPTEVMHRESTDLSQLSVLLPASIPIELLNASLQLARLGFRVLPSQAQRQSARGSDHNGIPQEPLWNQATKHPLFENCTPRQAEVVERLVLGLSNREIAQQLDISESTVKAHIRVVMEMLNVSNRTQIVSRLIFAKD